MFSFSIPSSVPFNPSTYPFSPLFSCPICFHASFVFLNSSLRTAASLFIKSFSYSSSNSSWVTSVYTMAGLDTGAFSPTLTSSSLCTLIANSASFLSISHCLSFSAIRDRNRLTYSCSSLSLLLRSSCLSTATSSLLSMSPFSLFT